VQLLAPLFSQWLIPKTVIFDRRCLGLGFAEFSMITNPCQN